VSYRPTRYAISSANLSPEQVAVTQDFIARVDILLTALKEANVTLPLSVAEEVLELRVDRGRLDRSLGEHIETSRLLPEKRPSTWVVDR
jgi:hypothetical protein